MSKSELALECFNGGFNCAQAVLSAFGPDLGLEADKCLRVAGAFGAGIGRSGGTCGAVSGALMAIGLAYSKTKAGEEAARDKGYDLAKDFMARFAAKNSTVICKELLGIDLSTAEGFQVAKESGIFNSKCPCYVKDACEILEVILD